jgi:hypothetical protein
MEALFGHRGKSSTDRRGSSLKLLLVAALVASVVSVALPARADHKPNANSRETGDICQSSQRVDGRRKFRIASGEKYFGRFKLCVTAPDGSHECKRFRMRDEGAVWARSISWTANYPDKGKGAYSVRWRPYKGDGQYGRRLGFHQ